MSDPTWLDNLPPIGATILVEVEVPRGSFTKRARGAVDFVSPLPSPFNYGAIPDTLAADGDRIDVVLLGSRRGLGDRAESVVRARLDFVDAGTDDPKLICADRPLTRADKALVRGFFLGYALAKRPLSWWRGARGRTAVVGWDEGP
jgi:inorganic pyrophosphatase